MSEWLAVEAIVRQREKEKNAKAVAKLTAEKSRRAGKSVCRQHEMDNEEVENDVFEDISDMSDPGEDFDEETPMGKDEEDVSSISKVGKPKNGSTTDSGNVEEDIEPVEHTDLTDTTNENEQNEPDDDTNEVLMLEQSEHIVVELENIEEMEPLQLQENCFADTDNEAGLTPEHTGNILLLSVKSSPSTSSYETVGNEFTDINDLATPMNIVTESETMNFGAVIEDTEQEEDPSSQVTKFHSADDLRRAIDEFNIDIVDEQTRDAETMPTHAVIITEAASFDALQCDDELTEEMSRKTSLISPMNEDITVVASLDALQEPKSACVSPASSNGGVYSVSSGWNSI